MDIEQSIDQAPIDLTLLRNPRVLMVDDEMNIIRAFRRVFRKEPLDIICTASPEEALDLLNEQQFTAIISDYRMPGVTGIELLEEARKRSPETIRILLTGEQDMNAAIDAICRFLRKSVSS